MSEEKLRKAFKTACLFPNALPTMPGMLEMNGAVFKSEGIELAFIVYTMGVRSVEGKLVRFKPDRSVTPGFRTQVKELLHPANRCGDLDEEEWGEVVKAVLQVAAAKPA